MVKKIRLDMLLTKKGLIKSRKRAKSIIMAGKVFVDNVKCDKSGSTFYDNVNIKLKAFDSEYVSRGGKKLANALKVNSINCNGAVCLDVGASTGGFTDCLIQHGAIKVFAVDVGYGQLAWKLRQNSKVVVIERNNIRYINSDLISDKIDIITIDVSFISLKIVVPSVLKFLNKNGIILALIKPQFEVGKKNVEKKGIIKSPILHKEVIDTLKIFFKKIGLNCKSVIQSPILGSKGNKEFLILLNK